jgi:predicted glycogen debranching enzyme
MVPNRFDDHAGPPHYNSIDASLWFIIAAERYVQATEDTHFWAELLMPTAREILAAYQAGTKFGIHADADGLLAGGSSQTQLTWMDAAVGPDAVTPRDGKAVEVNALWHSAHRIMARRCAEVASPLAGRYADRAKLIASAFTESFWNERAGCLYDCINGGRPDESMRPNQIFAVSLPYSPLPAQKQAAVVRAVTRKLLTPYGLRTLSPDDGRYQKRCTGPPDDRDGGYHQGTVWPFLLGPFVEAYLKVNRGNPLAVAQARHWLLAIDDHLAAGGLGFISEILDGDTPHCPRGCIAQAWSVAEILRAKKLIDECSARGHSSGKGEHHQ